MTANVKTDIQVQKWHLVLAAITAVVLIVGNIVAITLSYADVRNSIEQDARRIDRIESIDLPQLRSGIGQFRDTELQLMEIRVNLQAFMQDQGFKYQHVLGGVGGGDTHDQR